jgi:hypothetical protein
MKYSFDVELNEPKVGKIKIGKTVLADDTYRGRTERYYDNNERYD